MQQMRQPWFIFISLTVFACSSAVQKVPQRWTALELPVDGLEKVDPSSDENGFYADYSGYPPAELMSAVTQSLEQSGYTQACEEFDGVLKGFVQQEQRLVVKVDLIEGKTALSIFNEHGVDPLLHGVCFGDFELSPETHVIK